MRNGCFNNGAAGRVRCFLKFGRVVPPLRWGVDGFCILVIEFFRDCVRVVALMIWPPGKIRGAIFVAEARESRVRRQPLLVLLEKFLVVAAFKCSGFLGWVYLIQKPQFR